MNRTLHIAKWPSAFLGIGFALWLLCSRFLTPNESVEAGQRKQSSYTSQSLPAEFTSEQGGLALSVKATNEIRYLFDRSPTGSGLLISKVRTNPVPESDGDELWFQNTNGQERFVAAKVIRARFSPDGNKIAYSTSSHELFIETVPGKRLAQVSRASEPAWQADSQAVSFLAIPALDYADLKQTLVYDLISGNLIPLTNGN